MIERFFALAKQWLGIVTRFDKLAITYRTGDTLCTKAVAEGAGMGGPSFKETRVDIFERGSQPDQM